MRIHIVSVHDCTEQAGIARVITAAAAGFVVTAEDPEALAGASRTLRADAGRRTSMGERGRAYASGAWDRTMMLDTFEDLLIAVTMPHSPGPPAPARSAANGTGA